MSDYDGVEVAWPHEPLAVLTWDTSDGGHIVFLSPKTGHKTKIRVTTGLAYSTEEEHIWHIDVVGERATVSQSIHFVGHFHSPNPAVFRLTESLD